MRMQLAIFWAWSILWLRSDPFFGCCSCILISLGSNLMCLWTLAVLNLYLGWPPRRCRVNISRWIYRRKSHRGWSQGKTAIWVHPIKIPAKGQLKCSCRFLFVAWNKKRNMWSDLTFPYAEFFIFSQIGAKSTPEIALHFVNFTSLPQAQKL